MAANFGSDPWLDARLRNVPLPIGMLGRLSQLTNPPDDQLDAAVRDVPLPAGLAERLQTIPAEPRGVWPHLQTWLPERRVGLRELALAASLLLAVGIGTWMAAARFLGNADSVDPGNVQVAIGDPADSGPSHDEDASPNELAADSPAGQAGSADEDLLASPDHDEPLFPAIEFKPLPLPGPRLHRQRSQIFASDVASDHQPLLETVIAPADRGLAPPLVAGYDLLKHIKTGERSFAAPSADPKLASSLIPLRHDTSSYRLAQRYVSQGRLPPPEDVRIEDFLSAQSDHYPQADSKLVIRVEAGPAPLGEPGLRLLQVGVQAGRILDSARPATDLTIAVDTSASMRHGRRLEMVRSAIRRLAAELKPADRLTLIGFSDDAELLLDGLRIDGIGADGQSPDGRAPGPVDHAALERLLAAVDSLRPDDGTNVGAAIELASSAIRRTSAEPAPGGSWSCFRTDLRRWAPTPAARSARSCDRSRPKGSSSTPSTSAASAWFQGLWPNWPKPAEAMRFRHPTPMKSPPRFPMRWPARPKRSLAALRLRSRSIPRPCERIAWWAMPPRQSPDRPRSRPRSTCIPTRGGRACSSYGSSRAAETTSPLPNCRGMIPRARALEN